MTDIKVSIIVPVYNSESYIKECLQSLIKQTLKDIEIIIINDGSTDKSNEIIKEFALKDKRIKYISRENKGVGITRNEGVAMSVGEYIGFVDSDDTIEIDMFKKMYKTAILCNADIVECGNKVIKDGVNILKYKSEQPEVLETNINSDLNSFIKIYYYGNKKYGNHVWGKLYKSKIIKDNNIKFGNLRDMTGEDLFFGVTILPYVDKIVFLNDKFYNYNIRENSIMNSYNSQIAVKTIAFMEEIETYGMKNNLSGMFDKFLASYVYNLCVATTRVFLNNNKIKELNNNLNLIINEPIVEKYTKQALHKGTLFLDAKKKFFMKVLCYLIVKKRKKSLLTLMYLHNMITRPE